MSTGGSVNADGGANTVRTTGSGQRVGGVCGEGWAYVYGVRERGAFSVWGDRRQRKNASRRGKKRNPKKTQRVDGGAVNAVRTTGSGQRVGGVCGEELTKGFLELYVCKSRRRRGLLGTSHLECV